MLRNVINAKNKPLSCIKQVEIKIQSSVLGPSSNEGLDIIGPFPRAQGYKRYVVVATNYFTKWVKAKALANIRDMDIKKILWKSIITRFRVPHVLISDNRLQFDSKVFRENCGSLRITNRYLSLAYPQSNEQVEAMNKTIVNGLKKRLEGAKGNWVEELPNVLQAYRTTPRRLMDEIPFFHDIRCRGSHTNRSRSIKHEGNRFCMKQ